MKIATPHEERHPLFPINPSQKVEVLSILALFEHLVGDATPLCISDFHLKFLPMNVATTVSSGFWAMLLLFRV